MQLNPDREPLYPIGSIFQYWGETVTVISHKWDAFASEYDCICEGKRAGEPLRIPESLVLSVRPDASRN